MSLSDFFFPQHATARHVRELVDDNRRETFRARAKQKQQQAELETKLETKLEARLEELSHDLGYVTLILGSMLELLEEQGVVSREDLKAKIAEIDELDGLKDGRLDINLLKGRHR